MPVTDTKAIDFCNRRIRTVSNRLAQAYYRGDGLRDQWDSLGGGQNAIDVMQLSIREASDELIDLYLFCFLTEKVWFLGVNNQFSSNDNTVVSDGSPGDGRPIATTAKVNGVVDRVVEFQNWLFSATQSFTDSARNNAGAFNTVLESSSFGPLVMTVSIAGNIMNRFSELRTNYESNTNQNLGTLLALSTKFLP